MPDARTEARQMVRGRFEPRVLEPSPPAVNAPPWYGDDPAARGDVPATRSLLSPVGTGDLTWDELCEREPGLAPFCAERWLGAYRRIGPPPPDLAATRETLQRLAEHVIAPTRARANGRHGLRWTRGGFGTPYFGADAQLRVEGDVLVLEVGAKVHRGRITSLLDAAEFVGYDVTRFDAESDARPLAIDATASAWLGDWLGFGCSVLEQVRADLGNTDTPPVELDPGTFELRLALARGRSCSLTTRAPGLRAGEAELALAELLDAPNQRAHALAFLHEHA